MSMSPSSCTDDRGGPTPSPPRPAPHRLNGTIQIDAPGPLLSYSDHGIRLKTTFDHRSGRDAIIVLSVAMIAFYRLFHWDRTMKTGVCSTG